MSRHRYDPTRLPVPPGSDLFALCTCCTHHSDPVVRDGLWAKCHRCDQDCTNIGCWNLRPTARGIYGRFTRVLRSRLFR